jgi:ArsR family transcriptional regulator, arsenate/arsenite/antimonite-responsive transcriptional repressor
MGLARSWCRFARGFMSAAKGVAAKRVELTPEQVLLIAKALADPRRLELLKQIGSCTNAVECVAIRNSHPVSAATLSHHMKELEVAGLVHATRDGKFVSYTLRRDVLRAYTDQLAKL